MINEETIKSLYDDKPTLLEWLKKVEGELKALQTLVETETFNVSDTLTAKNLKVAEGLVAGLAEAETLTATDGNIKTLTGDEATFKTLTAQENVSANAVEADSFKINGGYSVKLTGNGSEINDLIVDTLKPVEIVMGGKSFYSVSARLYRHAVTIVEGRTNERLTCVLLSQDQAPLASISDFCARAQKMVGTMNPPYFLFINSGHLAFVQALPSATALSGKIFIVNNMLLHDISTCTFVGDVVTGLVE